MFTKIESKNNKKIKSFLNFAKSKKARKENNLCVLEGLRLITDAFLFGVKFSQIFINQTMLEKLTLAKSQLLRFHSINLLTNSLARQISSVENSQGVFAIVEKPKNIKFSEIKADQKVLVLVELNNPGNVGTLIRSAAAFNFTTIVLAGCCDIYNPKVLRSSASSIFKTKILECSVAELKSWLERATPLETIASLPQVNEAKSFCAAKAKGCALLIGNEANGLPDEIANLCKFEATLPMHNNVESLNAAVAGSILMFVLSRKLLV